MLDSITIKNFKAITELTLSGLSNVNYLVGKNGCGKSSVLEGLMVSCKGVFGKDTVSLVKNALKNREINNSYKSASINICHSDNTQNDIEIDFSEQSYQNSISERVIVNTETMEPDRPRDWNKCYTVMANEINLSIGSFNKNRFYSTIIKTNLYKSNCEKLLSVLIKYADFDKNTIKIIKGNRIRATKKYLSEGQNFITNFIFGTFLSICEIFEFPEKYMMSDEYVEQNPFSKLKKIKINPKSYAIIIEEPETTLHPQLQKKIPLILNEILNIFDFKLCFFIATHSPFIISAAAEFQDSQKIYLIDKGKTVGLDFDAENPIHEMYNSPESQLGFNGYQAKEISNRLLGAGLEDLHKPIVICEGEPNKKTIGFDAEIYNTIFYKDKYLFVSAGSETAIAQQSDLSRRVLKNIFNNTNSIAFYLKDGDNKKQNIKDQESEKYQANFGAKIIFLEKYSIESYLLDPEIVMLKYPENIYYSDEYQKWEKKIKTTFDHGKQLRLFLDPNKSESAFYLELAKLITSETEIYRELYNLIFN
jgi:predicted ATPase